MPQRIRNLTAAFNNRPFSGQGVSLYVSTSGTVQYRNIRLLGRGRRRSRKHWIKGTTGNHDIANSVTKTARVASAVSPTTQIVWAIPASMASQTVIFDTRHYKDDVESEVANYRTVSVILDANRDPITAIYGTATLQSLEVRAAGIVRLRLKYEPSLDGVQPTLFRATRTAGPDSPADATVTFTAGQRIVEIDTPTLLDSSAYTYKITAENGATTKDVLSGITVQADATGPAAPISGITSTK